MDTFWIIKSLTHKISALLSSFHTTDDKIELKCSNMATVSWGRWQTNNLICLQSLSPGVSLISRRNDHQPAGSQLSPGRAGCWCSQRELVFPFISIQLNFSQRENSNQALWLVQRGNSGPLIGCLAWKIKTKAVTDKGKYWEHLNVSNIIISLSFTSVKITSTTTTIY